MDYHDKIAADIFHQHGLSFKDAERAGGWTNAVWLNGDVVLRLSKEKGNDQIRRETERSKTFPSSVGYPRNIAVGVADGYEWNLSERVQGNVLSGAWASLNWTEKASAVKQIIDIMKSVHSVDVSKVENLTLKSAWYNSFDKDSSFADIECYIAKKIFTQHQGHILCDMLERFYKWNGCVTPVLCHGDITTDNLLWHNGNVVSLLDFEHSVIAPRQLDIHSIVNLAFITYDETTSRDINLLTETNCESPAYTEEMISLFKIFLSEQSDKDLFMGYNVLFRQRFLEFWLANPNGELEQCDAYQKLLSFTDGSGGYLSKLLCE